MDFTKILVGTVLLCLYLIIPGIALSLAVFPRRNSLGLLERAGVSAFFGFVVSFVQYFNDKNFDVPINMSTSAMTLIAVTFIGLAVWQLRLRMTGNSPVIPAAAGEAADSSDE